MKTGEEKNKTTVWEILTIVFIWLLAASLVYIVFHKAKIELNL